MMARRHGSLILEIGVAVTLAAAMIVSIVQLAALAAAQRRETMRRTLAMREAANIMEELAATPVDRVTTQTAAELSLSEAARRQLPGGRLRISVEESPAVSAAQQSDETTATPAVKRIRIEIDWQDSAGRRGEPVRLVAWRYPPSRAANEELP